MNEKPAESFLCVPMLSVHCPGCVHIILEFLSFFGALNNTIESIAARADWLTPQERQDKWHELFDSE